MSDAIQLDDKLPTPHNARTDVYHPSLLVKIIFGVVSVIWVLGIVVACIQLISLPALFIVLSRLEIIWDRISQFTPLGPYPQINVTNTTALFLLLLTVVVVSAIFLWIVWHLRKLIQAIKAGNPFSPENPGRIRKIGYAILLWAPVDKLIFFLLFKLFGLHYLFLGSGISTRPFLEMIFFGLVVLVIAEVFQRGVKLQQEQELTI